MRSRPMVEEAETLRGPRTKPNTRLWSVSPLNIVRKAHAKFIIGWETHSSLQ